MALVDRHGAVRWMSATTGPARLLVHFERDLGEGPGFAARATRRPVATGDLGAEPGVLIERLGLSPWQAFERLRYQARSSRRRITDVAADIVASVPANHDVTSLGNPS